MSIDIFFRFSMQGYILFVNSFKFFSTVPNSISKLTFFSHSEYFQFPIFNSCSENCSAVLSPYKYSRIFFVKENFSNLGHKYENFMHATMSLARILLGTTDNVYQKSPASITVTPTINKLEFFRSFKQSLKASNSFLLDIGISFQTINFHSFITFIILDCLLILHV